MIEIGRRLDIFRDDRLRLLCDLNEVEDEVHFLLKCPKLQNLREKYIPPEYCVRPGLNAVVSLLINTEKRKKSS